MHHKGQTCLRQWDFPLFYRSRILSLVIGIDPGSRITGYGVVESRGGTIKYVGSGIIKVDPKDSRPARLAGIKKELDLVLLRYKPSSLAVEDVFIAKNPKSALKLGEARGVILLAAAEAGMEVFEYSAREVKRAMVGAGGAHKSQVASMVGKLLGMKKVPESADETDALAVAFCHALRKTGLIGRLR